MDGIIRRREMHSVETAEEPWDIELYKDPDLGVIIGGAYSCIQGQMWHVEWSAFTNGFIIDWRQSVGYMVDPAYINSDKTLYKAGGSYDFIVPKTADNVKVGQRQWNTGNECNADWIKIRITQP